MNTLNDFLQEVPTIEESKNYWFFRTMGGRLYSPFFYKSIIALDYSKIEEDKIRGLIDGEINEKKIKFITGKYKNHRRPGLIITNLKKFYKEMKIGDYVIIPDVSGKNIAVGEITSNVERIAGIERIKHDGKVYIDQEYQRSRQVKWITVAKKNGFSPELYRLLNTHQTISLANSYSEWIDGLLYNFYKKGNKYHYIININQKYGLSAKTVYGTFFELLNITDEFLEEENVNENTDTLDTKIALTSPGFVEFLGTAGEAIAIISLLIIFINGGGFKIKTKNGFELELSSSGVIKRLNEFLNSKQDRKIKENLAGKVANLEIEKADDIAEILNIINQKNQND